MSPSILVAHLRLAKHVGDFEPSQMTRGVGVSCSGMTVEERQEVLRLIDAHERTLSTCRACAETARDLAWEVKRGSTPSQDALHQTIEEAERVLRDLGHIEVAIAQMRAALW